MANGFVDGDLVVGTIEYAVVVEDKKSELNLEIGFVAAGKLLGSSVDDGVEMIPEVEGSTRLFLGNGADEKKAEVRRGIARDQIEHLTGVRLEDTWKGDEGYQRLAPDHKHSLISKLEGKENVVFKMSVSADGNAKFWNVYSPRKKPVAMSLKSLKEKLREKGG
jgi:hypothetical protein